MDTLVSTQWLQQNLNDPDLLLLDCSVLMSPDPAKGIHVDSGRGVYAEGHIPGAVHADLKGDLCDQDSSLDFMMPDPRQFCEAMSRLGLHDESRVVLYDRQSIWAARVWWMLRWIGFDRAALLNGGYELWKSEGRPIAMGPPPESKAIGNGQLSLHLRPHLIAERDEVFAGIADPEVQIIDTLPSEMYRGGPSIYGRPGHIPTACNVSAMEFFDDTGCFKSSETLEKMFDGKIGSRNITYCGGGILASAAAFVMTRLGIENVAVYTASMQEWARDSANPIVIEG